MLEWLPDPLREIGPWGLAYWQWLGIVVAIVIAIIAGRLAARVILWLAGRVAARTDTAWDDEALRRLARPTRFLGKVLMAMLLLPALQLPHDAFRFLRNVLLAALGVAVLWGLFNTVDIVIGRLANAPWAVRRPASRSLLSLAGRTMKVLLIVIAAITFLGSFGLPVSSLIAGVGIGGIALAFGAQKTVENLFGAFSLGVDQPLREGDFVRVDGDTLGTVEAIGLRSTRIRTLDRTVVSIPNGRLNDTKIETFGARDRVRLSTILNLVYTTTAAQMRQVVSELERVLREHPKTWQGEIVVRFVALGPSSVDVEIMAWYDGSDFGAFRTWRQEVLLEFMAVVERAGTSFAFPTQTLHVASLPDAMYRAR